MMKNNFLQLMGTLSPADKSDFVRRRRFHQGWWRTAVLLEEAGPHPRKQKVDKTIANTLHPLAANQGKNYLSLEAFQALNDELAFRREQAGRHRGLINQDRAYQNLLSSQPLCFNFWGHLKYRQDLAHQILAALIPNFQTLVSIRFECEPGFNTNLTNDQSAFDVLIEYQDSQAQIRLIGLEAKYTDELTSKIFAKDIYRTVFEKSHSTFNQPYEFYIQPALNQLFRNHLMACAAQQASGTPILTGLFCSREDQKAISIANEFRDSLTHGESHFYIITYEDFIEAAQKQALSWDDRVWTMKLWARYIGMELSEEAFKAYKNG